MHHDPDRPRFILRPAASIGFGACLGAFATASLLGAATDVTGFHLDRFKIVEDQANSYTHSLQVGGAVDALSDGSFTVVWGSRRQENGSFGIFGQRYDALGRAIGSEFHVNQRLRGAQQDPAIATAANDTVWVVWHSTEGDGDRDAIFARRFRSEGETFQPVGDEFQVNADAQWSQTNPAIASSRDGRVLITWTTMTAQGGSAVKARLFDAAGQPVSDEISLAPTSMRRTDNASSAAALDDGRFAVTWARTDATGAPAGLFVRFIDADGELSETEIALHDADGRDHIEPSIASDDEGRFVVAWMRTRESTGYDVVARRFDREGKPLSDMMMIADESEAEGWKSGASVAVADDGRYVTSWNVFGDKPARTSGEDRPRTPANVFAQAFDADGEPLGERWRVNLDEKGQHSHAVASNARRALWTEHDQLAFAWDGHAGRDGSGIALTVMAPKDLDVPAPTEVVRTPVEIGPADFAEAPPDFNPDWKPQPPDVFIQEVGPDYGFQSFLTTPWQPPDPSIAAGPNHVVTVVNMEIKVHTKDGVEIYHDLFENIFRPLGGGTFIFDPVAYYDQFADRFVVAISEHNGSLDRLNMMISRTSDPSDGWHLYHFSTDHIGDFIDFQNLGIGEDAYYVTADYFGSSRNIVHIMEKAPMLNGDPVTLDWVQTRPYLISLGAVKNYDADATAQYFASAHDAGDTSIRLFAITDALGNPQVHDQAITVERYDNPPDATQRGSSNRVATIDYRIKHGVHRDGSLWLVHSIGQDNTARVRWYEIETNGWPTSGQDPTLVQQGTFDYGSGQHSWFPDVGVDAQGDVVIACSRSSSADYPYIARAVRKTGDPAGTFRESVRLQESTGPHLGGRWGDYSGIDEDPVEPGVFWSHNEYTIGNLDWRTWVGRIDSNRSMVLTSTAIFRGQNAQVDVTGATPSGQVYFGYSFVGEGEQFIPFLGVTIGLDGGQLLGVSQADANGAASLVQRVPSNAPRLPIWLQAAEVGNTSNVVQEMVN